MHNFTSRFLVVIVALSGLWACGSEDTGPTKLEAPDIEAYDTEKSETAGADDVGGTSTAADSSSVKDVVSAQDTGAGPVDSGAASELDVAAVEDTAAPFDSGPLDSGPVDSGSADSGPLDSGPVDSGPVDSGPVDSGPVDSGPVDSGPLDSGPLDSGPADAGAVPPAKPLRFALIGDYGVDNSNEAAVAKLVKSWKPEFIITVGDNNYNVGSAATIDKNVGKYYGAYIKPYKGKYGKGSPDKNRFWPSPGNHDWYTKGLKPYLDYFTLPHVERYYDFVAGPVHFLSIDSDTKEPDSNKWGGKQAKWIAARAKAVNKPFTFAYFHHPPYNSGKHGPTTSMRWPWPAIGVSATLAGHDHSYERGKVGGVWHIVQGIGGRGLYAPGKTISPGSQVRVYYRHGATLIEVTERLAVLTTIDTKNNVLDQVHMAPQGKAVDIVGTKLLIAKGSVWRYHDKGQDLGKAWRSIAYGDGAWKSGPAKLGYGDKDVVTTISYGSKSSNKHLTAYFRRAFTVGDPAKHKSLQIALRRDDGAVVYINGKEVMRSNMPGGTITFKTKAGNKTGSESAFHSKTVSGSVLVKGKNVVAIEVHQQSQYSSDLGFDFELKAPVQAGQVVFGFGSKWSYYDKGSAPTGWKSASSTGSWNSGSGPFGYQQGGVKTTISFGKNKYNKHLAYYFRKEFNVSDAAKIDYAQLRLRRDDGVVAYLNGEEVWRINMPVGSVTNTTRAGYTVSGQQEYDVIETLVDGKRLKNGKNVLAVEVHQVAPNSTDLFFDMSLATFAK